ncbi:hypothetical protein KP509_27G002300 [Ceratopteris richardii]|uniref:glucan endo-1,3-beta-D-glucosidase n=1 Tax=Ceratopteris richardii TaxID=49495 RepID=A0A8T2REY4_CERRI|nr:hypothetical protein KP509_27G002300 [Ceratopteris richardii]
MPFTTFFSPSPACQQLLLIFSASFVILCQAGYVGINYGTQFSASPSADQVVALLRRQSITNIRLYDANGTILQALAHTGIQVMVTVPNTELLSVGQSNASAVNWVNTNVLAYLPATNITAICVGTEVLTTDPNAALVLVPAMKYLRVALLASNLSANIKISTSNDASLILDSFPPSQAYFNKSLTSSILVPMLDFLNSTGSFFMLNIYCYDIYKKSNGVILLDYALLNPITPDNVVTDSNTLFQYHNLFDAVLDACYFALAQLKYSTLPVVISEAGWPSGGDSSDKEATDENASTFISNLIAHVLNNSGTPKRPHTTVSMYIMELFNEDLKVSSASAKNYGLFNGSTLHPIYSLRLSNAGPLLANDTTTQLYCLAKSGASQDELQIALDWACGIGRANCTAIQPGQLCYEPDTVQAHASYAFNNYYQKNNRVSGSCDFNGVATISTTNPSTGVCMYPGSSSNGTSNLTSANTMANFTSGNSTNLTTADGNSNNTSSSTSLLYGISSFSLSPFHILFSLLVVLSFTSLF